MDNCSSCDYRGTRCTITRDRCTVAEKLPRSLTGRSNLEHNYGICERTGPFHSVVQVQRYHKDIQVPAVKMQSDREAQLCS